VVGTRRLGIALIIAGLVGLGLTSAGWAIGPPGGWSTPGWMSRMHGSMHGSAQSRENAPAPSPAAREVRVVARDFSFSPSEVNVAAGETVNLTLANEGGLPHDITISAFGFRLPAGPGATESAALTPARPGTYEFYCSVPGHREAGMSGTLIVT